LSFCHSERAIPACRQAGVNSWENYMPPLSKLQQTILEECMARGGSFSRREVGRIVSGAASKAKKENLTSVVTQSIERLIDRGFLVGYGTKTQEKLFISRIRITPAGRREVYKFRVQRQIKLPLKKKR